MVGCGIGGEVLSQERSRMIGKVGRNDPCPCGSGRKYKKCCMEKNQRISLESAGEEPRLTREGEDEFEGWEKEDRDGGSSLDEVLAGEDAGEIESPAAPEDIMNTHGRVFFPTPDPNLPKLPAGEQSLVDQWCEESEPLFRNMQVDPLIAHILSFLESQPKLFVHLGLEFEMLFEIGAELGRRREWSRYAELLRRIRRECPEMYQRSFAYYEWDLIVETLAEGREEPLSEYFSFFHQYPDSQPDYAGRVADLLAWVGRQEELLAFIRPIAYPIWHSPDIGSGWFLIRWLVVEKYLPFLEGEADLDRASRDVFVALQQMKIGGRVAQNRDEVRHHLQACRQTPEFVEAEKLRSKSELVQHYIDINWNFSAYLHRRRGFPWVRSFFLAYELHQYWMAKLSHGKPKDIFWLKERTLDSYIARNCRELFYIEGVSMAALLEAAWHFADYLTEHFRLPPEERDHFHAVCQNLFRRCLKGMDSTDPLQRLRPPGFVL